MRITENVHALIVPFEIHVQPETTIDRFAFVYIIFGERIHLIDSGVAGAEEPLWRYIEAQGRYPEEIASLILTHAHPDHMGAAKGIKNRSGCAIYAHTDEQCWIEDTEKQYQERPVPDFQKLVEGPVSVDHLLCGGEVLALEAGIACQVIHTPGHSSGSISLLFEAEKALFTADALAFPGDLPLYEDIANNIRSIEKLKQLPLVEYLFSSWEPPIKGRDNILQRMEASLAYLRHIHEAVIESSTPENREDPMALCKQVVCELDLPAFAVNPLVAKAFASSLTAEQQPGNEILSSAISLWN